MPSYHVEFSNHGGELSRAALTAPSLPALAQRLGRQGHKLERVLRTAPDPSLRGYWRRVSEGELTTFLQQLACSLQNGVSLGTALGLLARETHNPTLRAILLDMERSVREGDTLSSALSAYPRLFSPIHVRLLEASEAGCLLPEALRNLAEYAERAGQANLRIRTALIYPQVVGVFTVALMCMTFLFVVPKFVHLFQELGVKELPATTMGLMWMSTTFIPVSLVAIPVAALLSWRYYAAAERTAPFRLAELKTRLPVLGTLYHNFGLLRLTRLMAALLRGGVPLLEALRLAGQGAESPLLQAAMWDAIPHVAAGESLAASFSHSGILPPTFCGQVAAAEASGDLPAALTSLADWYSGRVEYLTARVGALLEPAFVIVLAGLAGWVALGVFAPLISIIQSLSGGQ